MSANDTLVLDAVRGRKPGTKGWIRANCPLCDIRIGKADRKASFGFHVVRLRYECYRCGANGHVKGSALDEWADFQPEEATAELVTLDPPESFVPLGFGEGLRSFALAGKGVGGDAGQSGWAQEKRWPALVWFCVSARGRRLGYQSRIVVHQAGNLLSDHAAQWH